MTAFFCGADEIGFHGCWNCEGHVPAHVSDRRFCSHECAIEHQAWVDSSRSASGCTFCGRAKNEHPISGDCVAYLPMGATSNTAEFMEASRLNLAALGSVAQ